jgi:hypothetical protein
LRWAWTSLCSACASLVASGRVLCRTRKFNLCPGSLYLLMLKLFVAIQIHCVLWNRLQMDSWTPLYD